MQKLEKLTKNQIKDQIINTLHRQGFRITKNGIFPPKVLTKQKIRDLHKIAVTHRIQKAKNGLFRKENDLISSIASGYEITPLSISPRIIEVVPNSREELLFRYACLHWSIPISSGYGRRMRFIVIDESNGKLMGLIGLGDPVFCLRSRDEWIGWDTHERKDHLLNIMDAYVLGAVPPYSFLLCGKFIAMLITCDTIRSAFKRKYFGRITYVDKKEHDGRLALITTSSALGRSSVYNRIRYKNRGLFHRVGYSMGSGEFQFSNNLYNLLLEYLTRNNISTSKQKRWGKGFRNRREVVLKSLSALGISRNWIYHGIKREIFTIPLAKNTREFLCGKNSKLMWYHQSDIQLFEYFRERWMLPRISWDLRYESWRAEDWIIWAK